MVISLKKSIVVIALAILVSLSTMASCSRPANARLTVAELLDLGEKYLLELNYEPALVQFLRVIEIEPMEPRGYTGAAEAYIGLGDVDSAITILLQGSEQLPDNEEIAVMISEVTFISPPIDDETLEPSPDAEFFSGVEKLHEMPIIELSIDGILLGVTDLSVAKSKYSSRNDYLSNEMGQNDAEGNFIPSEDTVYSMPYRDDEDPEKQMMFGYLFVQPFDSDSISWMYTREAGFLCLGKYRIGDDAATLLSDICGYSSVTDFPDGENVFFDDGANSVLLDKKDIGSFSLSYSLDGRSVFVIVEDEIIMSVNIFFRDA